jgi:mono/diheme cytochrome c family protein
MAITGLKQIMIASAKHPFPPLALTAAVAMLVLAGCGQPATDAVEPAATEPTEPTAVANDAPLASIDSDGNIAPFGMASKQPVAVAELEVAPPAEVAAISTVYAAQCSACHGADATGVEGLGLNLVDSSLVAASSADELVAFLQEGRPTDAPESVTGVPMPAFAWMEAGDLAEVAAHVKGLQP